MKNIIVVGAGASGMMAALWAAKQGTQVTVLEQNAKPLKKLLMTGNGRCNLSNENWEEDPIRSEDANMALQVIQGFDYRQTLEFFEEIGIPCKERNGWIYPLNDSAAAVAVHLLYEAERRHIKIKTNALVEEIVKKQDGSFLLKTEGWNYEGDAVILACGSGASVKEKGYLLAEKTAKKLNMPYRKMLPALLSLKSNTKESAKWAGIRTRGKITLYIEEKAAAQKEGELQLIERGISGIPVFQISRYAVRALEEKKRVRMQIDFLPSWEKEKLLSYFQRQEKEGREKKLITSGLLPEKLAALFAQKEKSCLEIVEKIKSFCIEISAYGDLLSAQAECGGVLLRGLSPEMESRSCPGLYVIGEAADVDGSCGGYNLQWAWSSGKAAGVSAAGKIEEKEEC